MPINISHQADSWPGCWVLIWAVALARKPGLSAHQFGASVQDECTQTRSQANNEIASLDRRSQWGICPRCLLLIVAVSTTGFLDRAIWRSCCQICSPLIIAACSSCSLALSTGQLENWSAVHEIRCRLSVADKWARCRGALSGAMATILPRALSSTSSHGSS